MAGGKTLGYAVQDMFAGLRRPDEPATAGAAEAEGLSVFAPFWAAAAVFSVAGNPDMLFFEFGLVQGLVSWSVIGTAALLMMRPRSTLMLCVLAGLLLVRYAMAMPVSSNNQTIAAFMNLGILAVVGHSALAGARGEPLREVSYDQLRVIGRGLLAVMYFYGIFHKINTDFLDPDVSCAVALYKPIATPFGLGDNIYGKYLAIWSTFIVETITLVALYWKRWFAIGLFCGLIFHYVIPISGYSWYMDFSSLVLALYILSIPPEVGKTAYATFMSLPYPMRHRFGRLSTAMPVIAALAFAAVVVMAAWQFFPNRDDLYVYRSAWIVVWSLFGGGAMILLIRAALDHLPYRGKGAPRQPLWVYIFPAVLFITGTFPYIGLKTDSTIAMFSNLHTEGGVTNHLLFDKPPYLFNYQYDMVEILDSSNRNVSYAGWGEHMLVFSLNEFLRRHPNDWVTYRYKGKVFEKVTAADIPPQAHGNWFERTFLVFKRVDWDRPKICTH